MYRDLVKGNKICYNFTEQKRAHIHQQRIQLAEPKVDNLNPQSYQLAIPYANKRNQILEEKYTEIERENRILLEKITNIMHQKPEKPRSQSINPNQQRKTLHSEIRKKELVKITVENQQILNRIRARKPNYDTRRILRETSKHSQLVQRISEYQPPAKHRNALNRSMQGHHMRQGSGDFKGEVPTDRLTLYKGTQQHNGISYLIEIFIEDQLFRITADDSSYSTTKILEMSQSDGQKVLKTMFQNNVTLLAQSLLVNERIHIQGLEQFEQIEEANQEMEVTA